MADVVGLEYHTRKGLWDRARPRTRDYSRKRLQESNLQNWFCGRLVKIKVRWKLVGMGYVKGVLI